MSTLPLNYEMVFDTLNALSGLWVGCALACLLIYLILRVHDPEYGVIFKEVCTQFFAILGIVMMVLYYTTYLLT